ncbi:uncharacterized protein LOC129752628 [Uranotaenia lowii]|uniref:uncharacterized protein LOC129752628 n=1 Tax=Uranotaenia lowii TaxID=190385 RepID=UPI00247B22F6|nr:uncharacterized protein LOC129752628 [Uranotaenia lowii]
MRAIKYLGLMIDDRLSFTGYADYACKRATMATAVLSRAMSNKSAIRCSRRMVLASGTSSVLRYGAAAWKAALSRQCYLQKLCRVQRLKNLRVISAYRTVSSVAADVIPVSVMLSNIARVPHRKLAVETVYS